MNSIGFNEIIAVNTPMKIAISLYESLRHPEYLNIPGGKPGDKPNPGVT